jgi:lariat debranching enzyme
MDHMAVPEHHKNIGTFHKYYSGECVAPVFTIFIGGNHEASNFAQEL